MGRCPSVRKGGEGVYVAEEGTVVFWCVGRSDFPMCVDGVVLLCVGGREVVSVGV